MKQRLYIFLFTLLTCLNPAWAVVEYYDYDGDGVDETYNVVYLNLSSGNNSRDGSTVGNAVKTWAVAYSKLPAYTGTTDADRDIAWDHNIIVVCDIQTSGSLFIDETTSGNRPATITGVWPWTAENTTAANVKAGGGVYLNATAHNNTLASGTTRIGADTKFKYIRFCGQNSFLSMYLHDCMFDVGCVMDDINTDLTTANGAIAGRKAPDMQVFLFANTYNFTVNSSSKPDGGWPQQTKPVTLTIRSGKFGRILSNRVTGTSNDQIKQRYVIGNPDHPLMCVINVDIDEATTGSAWNTKNFTDDIAFLCAGMTQGAEYCDVEFNIHRGTIATLVGAMQGNSITNTPSVNLSNSSFFGRTKVTINPDNDADVVIQRYFAGCFGRETGGQTGISNAAFYGQSILNMYGGTIESGAYVSAGGISGLKSADGAHHTTDKFIPYVDASANRYYPYMGITYKTYDATMNMPKVTTTMHGSAEEINLEETKTEFNIYGGIIKGGLYGGSFGFSQEMPTERTMSGAGSLWGETTVNIYGGTITGGVYGGGMGDPTYYNTAAAARKADFLTVASVYGDTHVNIYGGTINGDIYGAGKGIPYQAEHKETTTIGSVTYTNYTCPENEFLEIAKVYGTTNVTIDPKILKDRALWTNSEVPEFTGPNESWTFTGNIYGGGALGAVEGETNVSILGGIINGQVFGAGEGEDGHPNKAKVGGTDKTITVNIEDGTINQHVYGGGNLAVAEANPTINISGGTISQNVYGGGYGAPAVLTGNTTINVAGGTIAKDVYGGGALANIIGSTAVNVSGGTVAQDVYGGGALANVSANTSVNLKGGTIRDSYGGGLGSNEVAALIGGDATTTLNGSIVLGNVFGCNNLNGTPQGHAFVDVKKTAAKGTETAEHPYHVAGVYGGGNLAAYVPTSDTEKAEVLIENCDNSIEDVFGGGNAAAVPETDVTVWGGQLGRVFAGGNGESAPANVTRDTHVMIHGGTIGEVYGGSNNSGDIGGTIHVDVAELKYLENDLCPINVDDLYGGGNLAASNAGQINIGKCTSIDRVFGGAHNADVNGDITLAISDGHINRVFGGNNEGGDINGAITVNIEWVNDAEASLNNVYGGGNLAPYTTPDGKEGPTVNLINGEVSENVYGGGYGEAAVVTGNPVVDLNGATVQHNIFGGGDAAPVVGNPQVNANYGSVKDIFAGGRGATAIVTGNPLAYVNKTDEKTLTVVDVYGGGDAANVVGTGKVQLDKGTVNNIYGGGNAADVVNTDVVINGGQAAMAFAGGHGDKTAEPQKEANVSGDAHLTIHGGTVVQAFAGSNSKGTITGSQLVTIVKDANALAELHVTEVYGGGNQADGKAGTFDIGCTGSDTEGIGDLFGGARKAEITGDIAFTIEGGKIDRIFGGNNVSGNVAGSITVNIAENTTKYDCGLNVGYVYGGGQDAAYTPTTPGAYPAVNIKGGTIANDVFGGGLGASAIVTSNPTVTVSGGSIGNNVFGGGSLAKTDGNPTVNVSDGTVTHDVYGGGALADVTGNTTVNLTGGAVGGAYGGALGAKIGVNGATEDVAAYVNGNTTVTLNGTKITETGIFGCNNLNGTPKGHAKVHVLSTAHRDGQATPYNQDGTNTNSYDVPAVYGGGNLSAYIPSDETFAAGKGFAEVLIENCDNSIEFVYGGGNAAPVPATEVTIYGANAINHAFAGGNGAGVGNPGADVGYLGYYSSGDATEYGTGTSSITVYGGTVHNVYGGSNTLGYIRGGTFVGVENGDGDCPLVVGNVFGGGNEADIECSVTMNLDCNEGGAILYAGANNANVHGDITLNIHSGTYGKVFCGNNTGGKIFGSLKVNVDETGCWPIMIGELYACGNLAPYSVYGYEDGLVDGKVVVKTEGTKLYNDPEVNLISFTHIGKVFGGGYGNTAVLYGDTHVNVDPIKGKFAGYDGSTAEKQISPTFVLNGNDERVTYAAATTLPYGISKNGSYLVIPDEVGSIGSIYGGGNAGAVYGNTNVNIGLKTTNHHLNDEEPYEEEEVAVTITGDVFGGGNEAIVSGDTNVKIGE